MQTKEENSHYGQGTLEIKLVMTHLLKIKLVITHLLDPKFQNNLIKIKKVCQLMLKIRKLTIKFTNDFT